MKRLNFLDGVVLFFFLSLIPALFFCAQDLLRHSSLTLESVEPKQFIPGQHRVVSVMGNGFDNTTWFHLDDRQRLKTVWINDSWIDLELPSDIFPGPQRVTARNDRGRMVSRERFFEVVWVPTVKSIRIQKEETLRTFYLVTGNYFEKRCEVSVNGLPVEGVEHNSPQELLIRVQAPGSHLKWTQVGIRNPSGGSLVLEGKDLLDRLEPGQEYANWAPKITDVIPREIEAGQDTGLVILGQRFCPGCEVQVGDQLLVKTQLVETYALFGVLPAYALPPGFYPLKILSPDGKASTFEHPVSIEATGQGTAEVLLWFYGLTPKELNGFHPRGDRSSPKPISGLRVLRLMEERRRKGQILLKASLPVQWRNTENGKQFYHANQPLVENATISIALSSDRTVSAVVKSAPRFVKKTGSKGSP